MVTQFPTFHAIPISLPCLKRSASAYSLESAEYNTSPHSLRTCVLSSSLIILRREMYPKTHNSYSNNRISYLPLKFPPHFNIGGSASGETASSFLSRRNRIITWQGVFSEYKRQVGEGSLFHAHTSSAGWQLYEETVGERVVCGVLWRCLTLHLLLSQNNSIVTRWLSSCEVISKQWQPMKDSWFSQRGYWFHSSAVRNGVKC